MSSPSHAAIFQLSRDHFLKTLFSPTEWFWPPCLGPPYQFAMDVRIYLDSQLYSIGLYIYPYIG